MRLNLESFLVFLRFEPKKQQAQKFPFSLFPV